MNYPQYAAPPARTNSLAMTSLISAVIAWVIGGLGSCVLSVVGLSICTIPIFIIGSIVATVTGHMAQKQIAASGGAEGGSGMATTGLVLGWIGNGISILLIMATCVIVILILLGASTGNVFSNIIQNI